jgi:hypothetical protein
MYRTTVTLLCIALGCFSMAGHAQVKSGGDKPGDKKPSINEKFVGKEPAGVEMAPVTGQVNDFVVCTAKTTAKKVRWIIETIEEGQVKPSVEPLADPLKLMVLVKSPGKYKVWAVAAINHGGADDPEIALASTFITITASENEPSTPKSNIDKLDKGTLPDVKGKKQPKAVPQPLLNLGS